MKKIICLIIINIIISHFLISQSNTRIEITGGFEIDINARPFQIALQRNSSAWCGGTILNQNWIVTAAHCVQNIPLDQLRVGIGVSEQSQIGTAGQGQVLEVSRVIVHPSYNGSNNDIALIELNGTIIYNEDAQPIRLINIENNNLLNEGQMVSVSGWGWTTPGTSSSVNHLRQVNTPLITNDEAVRQLDISYPAHPTITENMISAGFTGTNRQGACHGDSGGPLTAFNNLGIGFLVGVVSWGVPSCIGGTNSPSIYANVSRYQNWIYDNICQQDVILNNPIFSNALIEASNRITSRSQIFGQANVDFQSGNQIVLMPGFAFRPQNTGNLNLRIGSNCIRVQNVSLNSNMANSNNNDFFFADKIDGNLTAYPNPLTNETVIKYTVTQKGSVKLFISTLNGMINESLVDSIDHEAGVYDYYFNAANLQNGIYIYTLKTKDHTAVKRLIVNH